MARQKMNNKIDSPFAMQVEQQAFLDPRIQLQYLKNGSLESFKPDYLDATNIFKGIALRVEEFAAPIPDGAASTEGADISGLSYLRVRVRIPELHAHIPDPCAGSGVNADRAAIEMHPLFVSMEPTAQSEVPRPGAIVRVSFAKGPKGGAQSEGVYLGIYKRVLVPPGQETGCGILRESFRSMGAAGRVQQLGDLPELAQDSDVISGVSERTRGHYNPEVRERVKDIVTHGPLARNRFRLVTSEWGPRNRPCVGRDANNQCSRWGTAFHPGMDIGANPQGSKPPVYAVFSGKVTSAGRATDIKGNWIEIQHPAEGSGQYRARYLHLDMIADGITAGAVIEAGEHLGNMGNSGASNMGVHLHFEFYDLVLGRWTPPNKDSPTGTYDPRDYLPLDAYPR